MNKKQLPIGVRILLGFISVILCFALFACTIVTILVADLSLLTSKGGIQKLIKDVLFSTSAPYHAPVYTPGAAIPGKSPVRLNSPDAGSMDLSGIDFSDIDLSGIVSGDGAAGAIVDVIYGIMEEQMEEDELPFTKEEVTNFVEQSTLPEFISDKVSGIVSDVISGELTTTITKEDVVTLLEENKPLIEDTFKTEIPEEVIESVGNFVEESKISETIQQGVAEIIGVEPPATTPGGSVAGDGSSSSSGKPSSGASNNVSAGLELMDSITKGEVDELGIGDILVMVRFITDPTVLICCIAVCLLLTALLFLTNWGRPNAALVCGGIPYLLAGGLLTTPIAIMQFAPDLIPFDASERIIVTAVQKVLSLAGTISIGVTVLGLLMIVGGIVLTVILRNRREAAQDAQDYAAATAAPEATSLSDALLATESSDTTAE